MRPPYSLKWFMVLASLIKAFVFSSYFLRKNVVALHCSSPLVRCIHGVGPRSIHRNDWGEPTASYRWTLRHTRLKTSGPFPIILEESMNMQRETGNSQHVTGWIWNTRILTDYVQKSSLTLIRCLQRRRSLHDHIIALASVVIFYPYFVLTILVFRIALVDDFL